MKAALPFISLAVAAVIGSLAARGADALPMEPVTAGRDIALQTADGVDISARLYASGNESIIVYCHRLLGGKEGDEVRLLAETMGDRYDLMAFDFRGHKSSGGAATVAGEEVLDLRAALTCARCMGYRRLVVLGAGMGGTVGWRAAELFGNMDALVIVSPTGMTPWTAPFVVRFVSDRMLTSSVGRVPLRIIARTRFSVMSARGYPLSLSSSASGVPILLIQSEKDRLVSLWRLKVSFEELDDARALIVTPGREHAEDLIHRATIRRTRAFLDSLFATDRRAADSVSEAAAVDSLVSPSRTDTIRMVFTGESPLPERILLSELEARRHDRVSPDGADSETAASLARELRDICRLHGYARTEVAVAESLSTRLVNVTSPRIRDVSIAGNRWVRESRIRGILRLGGDAYNAYELDSAVRRLSTEPAVHSATFRAVDRDDGDIDIVVDVVEKKPYRFLLSTKFTDLDDFVGIGFTWNETNPDALRYEGHALIGIVDHDMLTFHSVSKDLLGQSLRIGATAFDNIKSRDDLDFVFTRQEVREIGGEALTRYRVSQSVSVTLGAYGKRCSSSVVKLDLPVTEGTAAGVRGMLDLSGALPLRREPRFLWRCTAYAERAGPFRIGDFAFEIYQGNVSGELKLGRHHHARTTLHYGYQTGGVPPQDEFSLGGMTTLRGYADDAFVGNRMAFVSHEISLSAGSLVDETSIWSPLRLVAYGDAGTTWRAASKFSWDELRMDAGFELEYMETLRAGCVWPVGGTREGEPRVYIGWGAHVI